jgi:tetratricopeptide (TPR) repeat protein
VLGFASYMRGEYEVAQRYHAESQAIFKQIGDRWGVGTGFINLGETARRLGDLKQAAQYYETSLPIFQEIDNSVGIAIAQLNLGHAYTGLGEELVAWQYIRESLQRSSKIGAFTIILEGLVGVASLWAMAGHYAPAAELLGLARSHPAFNAEIEVTAQPVFRMLREKLAPAQLEAALKHGQSLNLDEVVAKIVADRP